MSNYTEEIEEQEEWRVWRDTRGSKTHPGSLWEVSNFGSIHRNGEIYEPKIDKKGYFRFGPGWSLHRAVAELFLPPNTEHKPTIDHVNRIRTDNRAENLRYATYKEQAENKDWETIKQKYIGERNYMYGKHHSEEAKLKISEARKRQRNPMYGKHHTEETKRKMREYWAKLKSQS